MTCSRRYAGAASRSSVRPCASAPSASTHHLGVAEAVELGRSLGRLPDRREVIGIEGGWFGAGRGLSPEVRGAVEELETALRMEAGQPG